MTKVNLDLKLKNCKELILGCNEMTYGLCLDLSAIPNFPKPAQKKLLVNGISNLKHVLSVLDTTLLVLESTCEQLSNKED